MKFTYDHLVNATTKKELLLTAAENNIPVSKTLKKLEYEAELRELQSELVNLQQWIAKKQNTSDLCHKSMTLNACWCMPTSTW